MIDNYNIEMQSEIENFFAIVLTESRNGFEPEGRHYDLMNIEKNYQNNKAGFWICNVNGEIVGTVALRPIDEDQNIGELKRLYVKAKEHGKGYGKLLITYALNEAKELGFHHIRLDTTLNSYKAIILYKKIGFYEIERYNHNEEAELFMEIKI